MRRKRTIKYPTKPHSSGQARVQIQGKRIYLGEFGSKKSYDKFRRIVAEYEAGGAVFLECTLALRFHTGAEREEFLRLAGNLGFGAEELALKLIRDFMVKHPDRFLTGCVRPKEPEKGADTPANRLGDDDQIAVQSPGDASEIAPPVRPEDGHEEANAETR